VNRLAFRSGGAVRFGPVALEFTVYPRRRIVMARLFTLAEVKAQQEALTAKYRAEMRALRAMERVLKLQTPPVAEEEEADAAD
jgi:hypothetical protein